MPILDSFERLPLTSIFVNREHRQRQNVASEALLRSIQARGVLNPIIVAAEAPEGFQASLVAGEGRLEASRALGLEDIPVRWVSDLSEVELQIIELEENIKRTDLSWQDSVRATSRIHQLYLQLDPDWTMTETAEALGLKVSWISTQLRVASALAEDRISQASTCTEAYNVLTRRDAREQGEALEELIGPPAATASSTLYQTFLQSNEIQPDYPAVGGKILSAAPVLCESFLDWAPNYSGPKFNLIHCDFPYGTSAMTGPQTKGSEEQIYQDAPEVYERLLDCFVQHFKRFTSISAHIMFWASSRITDPTSPYAQLTWTKLQALPVEWWPQPLIWIKSDNVGVAADPRRGPRHIYEVCLFGSVGSRQIVRIVADAYACPSDRRLHPSAKPEAMLRHFFQMLVDHTSKVLDPTCGAGSALRAADSLGASAVLGLEIDQGFAETAGREFRNARLLRGASKAAAAAASSILPLSDGAQAS